MFEPLASRELAAEALREYMQEREYSEDPDIRQFAHFEGHLTPQNFHRMSSRTVPAGKFISLFWVEEAISLLCGHRISCGLVH
tara:strand:- start:185 stop:433 length:249 start_codon:yes stop_codon:yes gene_type:complete